MTAPLSSVFGSGGGEVELCISFFKFGRGGIFRDSEHVFVSMELFFCRDDKIGGNRRFLGLLIPGQVNRFVGSLGCRGECFIGGLEEE